MCPPTQPRALVAEVAGEGPRLVLVHGFTQNARCWGPFGERVGAGQQLVRVDLPGHGGSAGVRTDLPASAALVGDIGGRADYLGYSLGGRVLLHLALARPDLVRRLVLLGATPGIPDAEARRVRREADAALADELDPEPGSDLAAVSPAERLEGFLRRWLAGPLFATLPATGASVEDRGTNDPVGLASSLRLAGTGTQEPLWERLDELSMPVLVLAGTTDVRFAHIGARMVRAIGPRAQLSLIPGAGHACHLEQPEMTAAIVRRFLD